MDYQSFIRIPIVKNILGAIAFVLGVVIVVSIFLRIYTHHGKEITVPDLCNVSVQEAASIAHKSKLDIVVADSIFVSRMPKGAVFSQNPLQGSRVKEGRKIALTINAVSAKKVSMPYLIGFSMRQAKAELLSKGLKVGKLIYVSDMATNNVLKQTIGGTPVEAGELVDGETAIDLVVGLNSSDSHTFVPDLRGVRSTRAIDAIQDNSLNVGRLRYDESIKSYSDSLNAFVYSQSPMPSDQAVRMGESVSLYLTVDQSKLPSSR